MGRVSAVKHQLYLQQWAVKICECQNSGLTVVDWCRNQGVDTRRYYYWLAQLRKQTLDNLPELANISFLESKLATVSNSLSCQSDDSITFKKLEVTPSVPYLIIYQLLPAHEQLFFSVVTYFHRIYHLHS